MVPHYSNVLQGNSSCSHPAHCCHTVIFNFFLRSYSPPPLPRLSFALLKPPVFLKAALTYLTLTPFLSPLFSATLVIHPPTLSDKPNWIAKRVQRETKPRSKRLTSIKKHTTDSREGSDGQSNTQSKSKMCVCVGGRQRDGVRDTLFTAEMSGFGLSVEPSLILIIDLLLTSCVTLFIFVNAA